VFRFAKREKKAALVSGLHFFCLSITPQCLLAVIFAAGNSL